MSVAGTSAAWATFRGGLLNFSSLYPFIFFFCHLVARYDDGNDNTNNFYSWAKERSEPSFWRGTRRPTWIGRGRPWRSNEPVPTQPTRTVVDDLFGHCIISNHK
jgi:hypothetical protein